MFLNSIWLILVISNSFSEEKRNIFRDLLGIQKNMLISIDKQKLFNKKNIIIILFVNKKKKVSTGGISLIYFNSIDFLIIIFNKYPMVYFHEHKIKKGHLHSFGKLNNYANYCVFLRNRVVQGSSLWIRLWRNQIKIRNSILRFVLTFILKFLDC